MIYLRLFGQWFNNTIGKESSLSKMFHSAVNPWNPWNKLKKITKVNFILMLKYPIKMNMRDREIECNKCQLNFTTLTIYKKECSLKCSKCDKIFKNTNNLNIHKRKFHQDDNEEIYQCEVCWMPISTKSHLKKHLAKDHGKCTHCGEMFRNKNYLDDHMVIEYKERDGKYLLERNHKKSQIKKL